MNCIWFAWLNRLIPIRGLRLRICGWHLDHCPRCRNAYESLDSLPPVLITPEQLPAGPDLWPAVQTKLMARGTPSPAAKAVSRPVHRLPRWVYATVPAILLLAGGAWIIFHAAPANGRRDPASASPEPRARVCSARIGNEPARIFLIQSRNPDRAIFWIAKADQRS